MYAKRTYKPHGSQQKSAKSWKLNWRAWMAWPNRALFKNIMIQNAWKCVIYRPYLPVHCRPCNSVKLRRAKKQMAVNLDFISKSSHILMIYARVIIAPVDSRKIYCSHWRWRSNIAHRYHETFALNIVMTYFCSGFYKYTDITVYIHKLDPAGLRDPDKDRWLICLNKLSALFGLFRSIVATCYLEF